MIKNRELLLLRHAQAAPGSSTVRDFDRILTDFRRGQPDGVGWALAAAGFRPQLVLCSASARTRETLSLLGGGLCEDAELQFSQSIYECTTRQIMLRLAEVDDAIERVLLVGHNPGLSDVSTLLSHQAVGLSPCEYAWLEFEGEWHAVDAKSARRKTPPHG